MSWQGKVRAGKVMRLDVSNVAYGWTSSDPNAKEHGDGWNVRITHLDRIIAMNEPDVKTGRFLITVLGDGRIFWAHHTWFVEVQTS